MNSVLHTFPLLPPTKLLLFFPQAKERKWTINIKCVIFIPLSRAQHRSSLRMDYFLKMLVRLSLSILARISLFPIIYFLTWVLGEDITRPRGQLLQLPRLKKNIWDSSTHIIIHITFFIILWNSSHTHVMTAWAPTAVWRCLEMRATPNRVLCRAGWWHSPTVQQVSTVHTLHTHTQ